MDHCIEGVVIAAQCTATFSDLLCSPNLGITRTWVCRLNFAQRPIFSALRFFKEPEISDSEPPAWSPSRRTCAQEKIHRHHPSLNPRTLDLEASTLPWDYRGRLPRVLRQSRLSANGKGDNEMLKLEFVIELREPCTSEFLFKRLIWINWNIRSVVNIISWMWKVHTSLRF